MDGVVAVHPIGAGSAGAPGTDLRPPGDRYYRHPGDAVRLVLWGFTVVGLATFMSLGTETAQGLGRDLERTVARLPVTVRELLLSLAQLAALAVPVAVAASLGVRRRWRRLGMVVLAAAGGATFQVLLGRAIGLAGPLPGAVARNTWVASTRFPSLAYVAGAAAAAIIGKPWLSRPWRRAADVALAVLALMVAVAGSAGAPELVLALASGSAVGAALLVAFGAPNRRPTPAEVAAALRNAGLDVSGLTLERAEGGRAQLYLAGRTDGEDAFVKVYGRDSRDADLLYRGYRALLLRGPNDEWPSLSVKHDVEHEAFLLLLARQIGAACPRLELLAPLSGGSMALAMEHVAGRRLDSFAPEEIDDELLDATWREVGKLHGGRLAHRALRTGNVLVEAGRPVIIDLGFAEESATSRMQAIDRAELLTSMASLVGSERPIASALRVVGKDELAAAGPYLQPLALSNTTRKQVSKSLLNELRSGIGTATEEEETPLERLVRVRPRKVLTIVALMGAFYFLLPQLANVDDSFSALRSATWVWLIVSGLMSVLTYVFAGVALRGGIPQRIPLVPTVGAQVASSFLNRVTPANVGGMTLNVRFLRKAGAEPAEAVTAVGLNSFAGAIVHAALMAVFFAWAGQRGGTVFKIPGGSKLLVVVAVALALVGMVAATSRGRRIVRTHLIRNLRRSLSSIAALARSPAKLAALFGGSAGITIAYISALAAAVAAFHGHLTFAQAGAVYLGSSLIAAAAPTPGGLGALEAALVAGLTGVGMASGPAVATVLSYRLVTYWLPILPGWISLHALERRGYV